ncbi:MAG: WecB/TagA/CpsF family glycosyltransferase [Candidatus Dormibacteraeota bacterium]|nr:WecB/TagA/CpsF family glycosyltransferase [Candidatus Dormibacteraeota bacterium]
MSAEPSTVPRVRVLGCPADAVDMDGAVRWLLDLVDAGRAGTRRPGLVVTLNPEMVMRARRDAAFREHLDGAGLLVPDGIGIVRALRRRGHAEAQRVGGADLLLEYLPHAVRMEHRVALVGAAPGVAEQAARRLGERFPGLHVVAADGGPPDAATATRVSAARPEIVLAAYGAGLQEAFLVRYLDAVGAFGGIGVGGSLDYFSGRIRRAPRLVQRAGLEWAWRLAREPWRARRQLVLPRYWLLERLEAAARSRRPSPRP